MSDTYETFRELQSGEYFDSWPDFLTRRGQQNARTLEAAIRKNNTVFRELSNDVEKESVLKGAFLRGLVVPARSTPWPTFVLGSGCLTASASAKDSARVVARFTAAVRAATDVEGHQGFTIDFLNNLSRNRSEQPLATAGLGLATGAERSRDDWAFIGKTALAAMLLTRLYGLALAYSAQVVSDASREEVEVPAADAEGWLEDDRVVQPLIRALEVLMESHVPARSAQRSLQSLAHSVLVAVRDRHRVHRAHVELLTAFTWFILTEDTSVYPDWSDLLLFGAFVDVDTDVDVDENAAPPPWDAAQLKPRTPITADGPVAEWLTTRLLTITKHSWESRGSKDAETARYALYDAVAALLRQQADNYHGVRDAVSGSAVHETPLPTCFVTTFDLELEMAMWQLALKAETPQPFVIILPVVRTEAKPAPAPSLGLELTSVSLAWAWREIVPEPGVEPLTVLRDGGPEAWKFLDRELPPTLGEAIDARGRTPVIVRLAGSPLMNVEIANVVSLRQALLLDEYTALSQTVLDLTSAARENLDGDRSPDDYHDDYDDYDDYDGSGEGARPRDRNIYTSGLPTALTSSQLDPETAYMPRYWMFLGAQLSDSGVRLRLLTNQITAARLNNRKIDSHAPLGVAINRRSRPADRDVFRWYGLDVVRGNVVESGRHSLTAQLTALHESLEKQFAAVQGVFDQARREGTAS